MNREPKQTQIRVTSTLVGYAVGVVVSVPCDAEGTPLEFIWRRHIKGGACEIVTPASQPKKRRGPKPAASGDSEQ